MERIVKVITKFAGMLLIVVTFLLVALVWLQIVVRYFGVNFFWTEEVIRWLFIWLSSLGIVLGVGEGYHAVIDISISFVKKIGKRLTYFWMSVFSIYCFVSGIGVVKTQYLMQRVLKGLPGIPVWLLSSIMPFSFLLTFSVSILLLLREIQINKLEGGKCRCRIH